jgi:hypothetical protein
MSTQTYALKLDSSQGPSAPHYPGRCKSCGAESLFLRQTKVHLGVFCDCGVWQKWAKKSHARRYMLRSTSVRSPAAVAQLPLAKPPSPPSIENHASCAQRFEKIERELTVLVKAILACGVLQGKGGAQVRDVEDSRVYGLAEDLAEGEAGR